MADPFAGTIDSPPNSSKRYCWPFLGKNEKNSPQSAGEKTLTTGRRSRGVRGCRSGPPKEGPWVPHPLLTSYPGHTAKPRRKTSGPAPGVRSRGGGGVARKRDKRGASIPNRVSPGGTGMGEGDEGGGHGTCRVALRRGWGFGTKGLQYSPGEGVSQHG